jgi:hypothetical protein
MADTLTDAKGRAAYMAQLTGFTYYVARHPSAEWYVVCTIYDLERPKQWTTNPEGFPNLSHVVATINP